MTREVEEELHEQLSRQHALEAMTPEQKRRQLFLKKQLILLT